MNGRRITNAHVQSIARGLSERDRAIIKSVAQLKFVRATQLERLHFADLAESSRARRRRAVLARLTKLRIISPIKRRIGGVRAGSSGHIYTLGPAGQRLRQLEAGTTARTRRSSEPSLQFLDHTLAVAEIFTLVHETGLDVLQIETEPTCWRTIDHGHIADTLKPDLFAEVADTDYVYSWFVEIDLGTERRPALKRKLDRYLDAHSHGLRGEVGEAFPRVLWVVPDERRRRQLTELVEAIELFSTVTSQQARERLAGLLRSTNEATSG